MGLLPGIARGFHLFKLCLKILDSAGVDLLEMLDKQDIAAGLKILPGGRGHEFFRQQCCFRPPLLNRHLEAFGR